MSRRRWSAAVRRTIVTCVLLLLSSAPASPLARAATVEVYDHYLAPPGTCTGVDDPAATTSEQLAGMRCLINYARARDGATQLAASALLSLAARIKAEDIVRCDDFSHTACGRPMTYPFLKAGYILPDHSWLVGENLSYGTQVLGSPRATMRRWLYSDGHRANILRPAWRDQGVWLIRPAWFQGLPGSSVWVSHFGWRQRTAASPVAAHTRARLRLAVRPRRIRAGRRTRFVFRVTRVSASGTRVPVRGARILFRNRRVRTRSSGRARLVLTIRRPGRYQARARKAGLGRASAVVSVLRR